MKYGRKSKSAKSLGWDTRRVSESILHYFGYIKDKNERTKKKKKKRKHSLFPIEMVSNGMDTTMCMASSCPPALVHRPHSSVLFKFQFYALLFDIITQIFIYLVMIYYLQENISSVERRKLVFFLSIRFNFISI